MRERIYTNLACDFIAYVCIGVIGVIDVIYINYQILIKFIGVITGVINQFQA